MKTTSWTPEWKAEAEKQKVLRRWTNKDLARAAGLGISVVTKYMAGTYTTDSPRGPIERALGMENHYGI